jgi:histidinol-phosphatase
MVKRLLRTLVDSSLEEPENRGVSDRCLYDQQRCDTFGQPEKDSKIFVSVASNRQFPNEPIQCPPVPTPFAPRFPFFVMFPEFQLPTELTSAFDGRVRFAMQLAVAASRTTLKYFRTDKFQVERKRDKSPVTQADKETESVVRSLIATTYPTDAIVGEEMGNVSGSSDFEWIIDPIDGTKSFISGVPLYSTLVGMTYRKEPTIGVITIPALGELIIAAKGLGAWYGQANANDPPCILRRTQVSSQPKLEDGLMLTSQSDNFQHRHARDAFTQLESMAYITRTWGDGYGYLLVATGRAEVMIDPIVNPWDIAAVAPVIVEAGGRFTTWSGEYNIRESHCVGSNGLVHDQVLQHLKPYA